MSDTEGLCLNITVPKSQDGTLDAEGRLPVVTFIHGGGFNNGSGMFPHYDMARFVQLSVKEGMPCIAVVLKYVLTLTGSHRHLLFTSMLIISHLVIASVLQAS